MRKLATLLPLIWLGLLLPGTACAQEKENVQKRLKALEARVRALEAC